MNVSESDTPETSLNGRLPAYETYRPRFDTTRLFSRDIMHSVYIPFLCLFMII